MNAALIAVASRRRKIIAKLRESKADAPERAIDPKLVGPDPLDALGLLTRDGIVVSAPGGRVYLNESRLAAKEAEDRRGVQMIRVAMVVIAVVAALVALVRSA